MEEETTDIVRHLGELAIDDLVEAWHDGRRYNRGKVMQTIPSMGLFWILDTGSGTRKLVDFEALLIRRVHDQKSQMNPSDAGKA